MSSTVFTDQTTIVVAAWLNDINSVAYNILGNGTVIPATVAAARTNLGLGTMATQNANAVAITGGSVAAAALPTATVDKGGTGLITTTAYSPVFSGTTATGAFQATLGPGTAGQTLISTGAGALPIWSTPVIPGSIFGLTLSNNVSDATNDIDIAAGSATDTTKIYSLTLASTFTKRLDAAWAVGSGNGGLDTGAIGNSEYNIWLIRKDSDGSIDALFSLSSTAPTMPAGYTAKRRIGSIFRASATIRPFIQKGDRVYYKTPPLDVDTTLGTSATSYTISVPASSIAIVNAVGQRTGPDATLYVYSPEVTDQAVSLTVSPLGNVVMGAGGATVAYVGGQVEILTSSTSQIRAVAGSASTTFKVATVGYIDTRGKDV